MPLWIGEASGKPARGRAGHGAVTSPAAAYAHGGALLALHTRATGEDTAVLSGALCQTTSSERNPASANLAWRSR